MHTKLLFLAVTQECDMTGSEFLRHATDCIRALSSRYPLSHLVARPELALTPLTGMSDACNLHDDYESAMIHGIIARKTENEALRARAEEEGAHAYRKRWREFAAGRRALPGGDAR